MKDHEGAAYAMEMAKQVWLKPGSGTTSTMPEPATTVPHPGAAAARSAKKTKAASSRRRPPAAFQPPTPQPPLSVAAAVVLYSSGPLTGFAYGPMSGGRATTESATKKSLDGFNPLGFSDEHSDKTALSSPTALDRRSTAVRRPASTSIGDNEEYQTLLPGFFGVGIIPAQSLNRTTILKVFAFLSDPERRKARLVCKNWASVLMKEENQTLVSV
jgi:hypothetical protein